MPRTAVVDLGSNSFRLVVFSAQDGWWKRTDEIYEAVRIGAGLDATGELDEERIQRAVAVTEVFAHFCEASAIGLDDVSAVATSAIRDAANRDVFCSRAALPVRVLPVEEEARYGYLAAVNSTTLSDGAVLDLGGGSLQLTRVAGRLAHEMDSWPLGAVRMTEHFLPASEPASKKQLKALRAHVAAELERAAWLPGAGRRLVGVGGTVRNLAGAAAAAEGLPSIGVQGHVITRERLDDLVAELASLAASERGKVPGIKPARADVILAGAAVVQAVLEAGDFEGIEATEAGLREGVFFERHLAGDGPPLFADVRRASVENLAAQYGALNPHTEHVARLALSMFDDLATAGVHDGDEQERDLLSAAAVLHDIGMSVDYDDHHRHSRYLVLNGGLPGYAPREAALIAEMVRYHRKGTPAFGSDLEPWTRKSDRARLARGATLLRLAEGLERSRDQAVHGVRVEAADGTVAMALEAEGDVPVARWAAERERDLFKRAFGRDLEIRERGADPSMTVDAWAS
jgi:exopolyphosphatase / guanosine-5'-triphosphate,3'-diphosphate pyrophosphatase